jgi:hypothetical protein
METTFQHQDRLHYAEVYVSDVLDLKKLFLKKFESNKINENFGIPFLLAKKGNSIVAFASLMLNQDNQIDFEIYDNSDLKGNEREDFKTKAKSYCKRNNSENFRNPEELQYNTQRMVEWLND